MSKIPPIAVQDHGQSIWYDNIQRSMLDNGDMQNLIDHYGVLGVTSNPTIFQKAIGETSEYDAQIAEQSDEEDPYALFEALAITDIRRALDLFLPVYQRTERRDGYVSLEVSPLLAHDTETTAEEAKRLFKIVDRPNLMIKIPSTPEGIPAIEEAIASGVNVNITLIFSVKNYEEVMEAYLRGLERRLANGQDISNIASVASFFLSRIDTVVDRMLENNIRAAQGRDLDRVAANRKLLGTAAIANAKLAYRRFQQIFSGERWEKLKAAGARVQRPLWASTGTKNPAYSDTMYIDHLIGPDTVNTVPPKTLMAFADHGNVSNSLTVGVEESQELMDMLAEVGIDIDEVTKRLQDDGVEAFVDSFKNLLEQVEAKRAVLRSKIIRRQNAALGVYTDPVNEALEKMDADFVNGRIWNKDGSVWKDHAPTIDKIQRRLGWLDILETIDRARLQALQDSVKGSTWTHVVLLGMGGSSLAPEVLYKTFGKQDGFPSFLMLDSTDPAQIKAVEDAVDLKNTLFIVASKSGSTVETDSFYRYFYKQTGENGAQFIAITDPETPLEQVAKDNKFRDLFLNPPDIGGRYSALSYFGLVPAALMGLDLKRIFSEAELMITACGPKVNGADNPGLWLGAVLGTLAKQGRNKVTIFSSDSINSFGNWIEQLIAESTGKEGQGILPVVGATVGKPHDYVTDRLFIYLKVENDPSNAELDVSIRALREAGHPRVSLHLNDRYALAGEFFRWEYATAVAGKLLEINPFDEPNVTEAKEATGRLLAQYTEQGALPQASPVMLAQHTLGGLELYMDEALMKSLLEFGKSHNYDTNTLPGLLAAQLNATHAGDYLALLVYAPQSAELDAALLNLRTRMRHTTKRAVTLGYGPRYLHSTGQFHKGGPNTGVFFQITVDNPLDLPIPGMPYSFGVLKAAQAAGDLEALQTHKRRVFRLHSKDARAAVEVLLAAVEYAEERRK